MDLDNYLNKITMFHKFRPRFIRTVSDTLQPTIDVQNKLSELYLDFDLDLAIGVQLDVVGQWINLSRNIVLPVPDPWFRWGDAFRGWGKGIWHQPYDSGTYITQLDDITYRRLLKARIKANQWNGTSQQALDILKSYFTDPETFMIIDDKNIMQLIYGIAGKIPSNVNLGIFSRNYLPLETAGVKTYYFVTSVDKKPLFGFGLNNDKIAGWGTGAWGVHPEVILNKPTAPSP